MKYLKIVGLDSIAKIIGECINITSGVTYYDLEGKILDTPKPKHNALEIDSIEYEIVPNMGVIYLPRRMINDYPDLPTIFASHYTLMCITLSNRGHKITTPYAVTGTSQYLIVSDSGIKLNEIKFMFGLQRKLDAFTWCIMDLDSIVSANITSLSSIVCDLNDMFDLEDGHKSIDSFGIDDIGLCKSQSIISKPIYIRYDIGLTLAIVELSKQRTFEEQKYFERDTSLIDFPIRYLEWSDVKPYNCDLEYQVTDDGSIFHIFRLIRNGLFLEDVNDDLEHNNYKCAITGLPIYEDCYVLDIYSQQLTKIIPEDELDKYPNAKVITEDGIIEASEYATYIVKKTKTSKPSKPSKKPSKKVNRSEEVNEEENEEDPSPTEEKKVTRRARVRTSRKYADVSPELAVATYTNLLKKYVLGDEMKPITYSSTSKVIKKKGVQPKALDIKIIYEITYDTPKQILISPFWLHLYGLTYPALFFKVISDCKFLIYRTFCPVTLKNVIDNLSVHENLKKVLHALNETATIDYADSKININADGVFIFKSTKLSIMDAEEILSSKPKKTDVFFMIA